MSSKYACEVNHGNFGFNISCLLVAGVFFIVSSAPVISLASQVILNATEIGAQGVEVDGSGNYTGGFVNNTSSVGYIGYNDTLTVNYQYRGYALFSATSIPSNAVIDSVYSTWSVSNPDGNNFNRNYMAYAVDLPDNDPSWKSKDGYARYLALNGSPMWLNFQVSPETSSTSSDLITLSSPVAVLNSVRSQSTSLRIAFRDQSETITDLPVSDDSNRFQLDSYFLKINYAVPPTTLSPLSGATVSLTPELTWNSVLDSALDNLKYVVEISTDNNFNNIAHTSTELDHTTTSISVPSGKLNASTSYYWRVKVVNGSSMWSSVSAANSFVTPTVPSQGLVAQYYLDGDVVEVSGNGLDGNLLVPGPIACEDRHSNLSGALCFDGVDDYVDLPVDSRFFLSGDQTLTAWIKTSGIAPQHILTARGGGD